MTFLTSLISDLKHFESSIKQAEKQLKKVQEGSDAHLQLLLHLSFFYAHQQLQQGVTYGEAAYSIAKKRKDVIAQANALCMIAMNEFRIGYTDNGILNGEKGLALHAKSNNKSGMADANWILGTMVKYSVGPGNTAMHLEKANELYKTLHDEIGMYLVRIQFTAIPMFQLDLETTFNEIKNLLADTCIQNQEYLLCYCYMQFCFALYFKQDLAKFKTEMESWMQIADAMDNFNDYTMAKAMLTDCCRIEQLDKAVMQACLESIECCEKLGSIHGHSTMALILANICMEHQQYSDARKHFKKAAEYALQIGDTYKNHFALNGEGVAYMEEGKFKEAGKFFDIVLSKSIESSDRMSSVVAQRNLAELALKQGKYDEAFKGFKKLFQLAQKQGLLVKDYGRYAQTLALASDKILLKENIKPSERNSLRLGYLKHFLEVAKQEKNKREQANAYAALSVYYEENKVFKTALEFSKKHTQLYEELINEQNIKSIAGLRLQYESEKQEQEINLLREERKYLLQFKKNSKVKLPEETFGLTKKELEILALMVDGMSYKMISQKCFISFETVKTHIRNIYAKMKVSTMTEAVVLALRKRIV